MENSARNRVLDRQSESSKKGILWKRILILCSFSYTALAGYFQAFIARVPLIGPLIAGPLMSFLFPVLIVINFSFKNFRRIYRNDIIFILLTVIISIVCGVNYTDKLLLFLFNVLPVYFVGAYYLDDEEMQNSIEIVAIVSLIVNVLYYIYYARATNVNYDMYRAYTILPHQMVMMNACFRKKPLIRRIIMISAAIVGFVFILALGTRGPIIVIMVFLVVLVYRNSRKSLFAKMVMLMLIAAISLLGSMDSLISHVSNISRLITKLGMSTRSIDLFMKGEFLSHLSGRDDLLERSFEMIQMRPIWGYGLWGEYPILQDYPHNYYVEVILHFGVFIGPILIIAYAYYCLTGYFAADSSNLKDMILIMGVYTLVHGFMSGSYLQDSSVFFLLGLCVCSKRLKKKKIS